MRYHSLAAVDGTRRPRGRPAGATSRAAVVMGVRAPDAAAARRAVPPRVDPDRARRRAGRELPRSAVSAAGRRSRGLPRDALPRTRGVLARRRRRARWSGRRVDRRLAGRRRRLADLRRRTRATVTRAPARPQRGGRRRRVRGARGRAARATSATRDVQLGRLLRLCLPPRPARLGRPGAGVPDACWMRAATPIASSTTARRRCRAPALAREPAGHGADAARPCRTRTYAAGVRRGAASSCDAGNSYEVNLTYRDRDASSDSTR